MVLLYSITTLFLIWSFFKDKQKTVNVLIIGWKGLLKILPPFIEVLILVAVALYFLPDNLIARYLGANSGFIAVIVGGLLGSIAIIPGFIAYPMTAVLIKNGVGYMAATSFITTLMMVGVFTFPIEKEYFGVKVTIIRNIISFILAIIIAVVIGLFYGETL